jgi:hypothetical protein
MKTKNIVLSKADLLHVVFDRASGLGFAGCGMAQAEIERETRRCVTAEEVYQKVDNDYKLWLVNAGAGPSLRGYVDRPPYYVRGYDKKYSAAILAKYPWSVVQEALLGGAEVEA